MSSPDMKIIQLKNEFHTISGKTFLSIEERNKKGRWEIWAM